MSKAEQLLNHIKNYIRANGLPPTRRDLAAVMGTSTSVITYHLAALERDGFVTVAPMASRGIRVVGVCPCCGNEGKNVE